MVHRPVSFDFVDIVQFDSSLSPLGHKKSPVQEKKQLCIVASSWLKSYRWVNLTVHNDRGVCQNLHNMVSHHMLLKISMHVLGDCMAESAYILLGGYEL